MRRKLDGKVVLITTLLGMLVVAVYWAISSFAQSPQIFGGKVEQSGNSLTGITMPRADIVFLDSENSLWIQRACRIGLKRVAVIGTAGTLIGIDYRPADGRLYGLDDANILYIIDLDIITRTTTSYETSRSVMATRVNGLTVPFGADIRSLMDFNPVLNALRLIGANDQNYAVVNSGDNLNVTAAQAPISYVSGDSRVGLNPNLVAGAYSNNVNPSTLNAVNMGTPITIFYGIDYVQDTLVTIAELNASGSSNTGGGKLRTIGGLVKGNKTFDAGPSIDFDIYTVDGVNKLIGVNGNSVFTLNLPAPFSNIPSIPVRSIPLPIHADLLDVSTGPPVPCAQ